MTKIAGSESGSISQMHGSADPDADQDPHQQQQICTKSCLFKVRRGIISQEVGISFLYCFYSILCWIRIQIRNQNRNAYGSCSLGSTTLLVWAREEAGSAPYFFGNIIGPHNFNL
jgi:hypothetical protein